MCLRSMKARSVPHKRLEVATAPMCVPVVKHKAGVAPFYNDACIILSKKCA